MKVQADAAVVSIFASKWSQNPTSAPWRTHLSDDYILMLMTAGLQTTASAYYSPVVILERVLTG